MSRNRPIVSLAPLVDGVLVILASWLAYAIRWDSWSVPLNYLSVMVLGTGLLVILLPATGAYRSWRGDSHWRDIGNTLPGLVLVTVLLMVLGTLTKTTADFSRLWMGYWFLLSLAAMFLFRWCAGLLEGRFGSEPARVLVVGDGEFAARVAGQAVADRARAWEIAGFVRLGDDRGPVPGFEGVPCYSLVEMDAMVCRPDPDMDEVWIAMETQDSQRQAEVVRLLQGSCVSVRYFPDLSMLALLNHVPTEVSGMTAINLNASPLAGQGSVAKLLVDRLVALVALALLSPLMTGIAIAVKRDSSGPVFFRQKRHGWDGRIIEVLKFRTMYHGSAFEDGQKQASSDDDRVTPVGRFLRRTSLDELPQFINVLKGDMSVVGPRPHPVALNESYVRRIDAYMQRHRVKPGITGWAQIHGLRGETETLDKMQRRVEYDLYYIEHWSLWLDIKIILLTLFKGWAGKNAY